MVQFLSINFFSWISSIFVGFFKSSRFLCHSVYQSSPTSSLVLRVYQTCRTCHNEVKYTQDNHRNLVRFTIGDRQFESQFPTECDLVLPLQFPVPSRLLKVFQYLLISSSTSSHRFYLSLYNVFYKAYARYV